MKHTKRFHLNGTYICDYESTGNDFDDVVLFFASYKRTLCTVVLAISVFSLGFLFRVIRPPVRDHGALNLPGQIPKPFINALKTVRRHDFKSARFVRSLYEIKRTAWFLTMRSFTSCVMPFAGSWSSKMRVAMVMSCIAPAP
jgi:hypothetical protein